MTLDGQVPSDYILGKNYPLNLYYAYGIRNSFGIGIDFDPITSKLWDRENGPSYGDEINLVEPGFNSGWSREQGIWMPTKKMTAGDIVSKTLSSMDILSSGRLFVGLGEGSSKAEYEACGIPFEDRWKRFSSLSS